MLIEQETSYKSSLGLMINWSQMQIALSFMILKKKNVKTAVGLLKKQETRLLLLDRYFEHKM